MRTSAPFLQKRLPFMARRPDAAVLADRRRMNVISAALAFAGEIIGIGVKKQKTGVLLLKAQNHLSTRNARQVWRTKTRKSYRHH